MKDVGELGVTAADLMDRIEEDYADFNDVEVGVVAVIAEINYEKDGEEYTSVEYRCSDPRKWIQSGLSSTPLVLFSLTWRTRTDVGLP